MDAASASQPSRRGICVHACRLSVFEQLYVAKPNIHLLCLKNIPLHPAAAMRFRFVPRLIDDIVR